MEEVLLVVYGVLWAASTPGFSRLRGFAFNGLVVKKRRRKAVLRLAAGVLIANVGPVALLVLLLCVWPRASGGWGVAEGALAGISVAVFPRLLHALTASDGMGKWFHDAEELEEILRRWDPVWSASGSPQDGTNSATAHLATALAVLAVSAGTAWVIGALAA